VSTFDHACALVSVARYSPLKLARKFDRVGAALARYIVALIDYFIANLTSHRAEEFSRYLHLRTRGARSVFYDSRE